MNEIKFRAWDKKNKQMIYDNPFSSKNTNMTWTGVVYDNGKVLNYEMLQYTGVEDKNKKEVYEGDIVEFKNGLRKKIHFVATIGQIIGCANLVVFCWVKSLSHNQHINQAIS